MNLRMTPTEKKLVHRALVILGVFTLITIITGLTAMALTRRHQKMVVPRILGMDQAQAKSELESKNLKLVVARYQTDEHVPAGLVSFQEPKANAYVPQGSPVSVAISKGQPKVLVPLVIGLSSAEAQITLAGNRLRVGRESLMTSNEAKDTVLAQVPDAKEIVDSFTEVNLLVSMGPTTAAFVMPDLKNQPLEKAFKALRPAGITIEKIKSEVHDDLESETVLSQTPPTGTKIQNKDNVSFVVSAKSSDGSAKPRYAKVIYDMPEGTPKRLQIDVFDATGTRTIYNKMESPKNHIELDVTVTGKASAQVYLNQEFTKEIPIE
jgi:beta-lactam-binding protein with PASTA domain